MTELIFILIYTAGCTLSMMAGYILGNYKATGKGEETRRWWMTRQIKRERK
jgi:membrane protein YqaA with SNARE-associated domain